MWKVLSNTLAPMIAASMLLTACESPDEPTNEIDLIELATRYAEAWSNGDPVAFASFYAEDGTFRINDGEQSVGREAIAETAGSFMAAFPDMHILLVGVRQSDEYVEFHWHWTGTNTGPGGTGNPVDLKGFEQWTLGEDGLILESRGNMDDAEYQRQLNTDPTVDEVGS